MATAPPTLRDAIVSTDSDLISDAKSRFDQLLSDGSIPKRYSTAVSVITVITDVVEYTAQTIKKSGGNLTSQQKLNLAFSIGQYCNDTLLSKGMIDQPLHDDIATKISTTQVFTEIVGDIISIIKNHSSEIKAVFCCGCKK